ncbi:cadherin-87A [Condylostylus longicornis]|uniref:cadherin-87A n=1 Tax=Condylostylus longicornis TaxID=2530218 RepID=UPI00244DE549|nr:cadherin-87A [Condylostylus longicornis]
MLKLFLTFTILIYLCNGNLAPIFTNITDNLTLSESTPVGSVVFNLDAYDPEGENVTFDLVSDYFQVNSKTGAITLIKKLDHEKEPKFQITVSLKDKSEQMNGDNEEKIYNDVQVPINVLVLDENDRPPVFQNTPYIAEISEDAPIGSTVFANIKVTDIDTVGESLEISCIDSSESSDSCTKFDVIVVSNTPNELIAKVVTKGEFDYNEKSKYFFNLTATDGIYYTNETFEVRLKDVQNKPPVFDSPLVAIIDENAPIGTTVLKIHAHDADTGDPRKIYYDLLTNPLDYFLLDSKTGELKTARPLDKEAVVDPIGNITLTIRAREIIDGSPSSNDSTTAITNAYVILKDINDTPPTFNKKEYNVTLSENTIPGTVISNLEMNVTDADDDMNSIFTLELNDVSGAFDIDPKEVHKTANVTLRVKNAELDYENPNHRKFIILIIAKETHTKERLSSTATITVTVTDENDNKPIFEQDSYTASVSESADPDAFIATIKAKDIDSGDYGDVGIRYSLSGTGSHLFNVDEKTGVITLANCHMPQNAIVRKKREQYDSSNGNLSSDISVMQPSTLDGPDNQKSGKSLDINSKCLDYETEKEYRLAYKATDDLGKGQSAVVPLKILVVDANDSPPICDIPIYRAVIDEGAKSFEYPLIIRARDADTVSEVTYRIIGNDTIHNLFDIDKRSGQITLRPNVTLDVNNLNTSLFFGVEASDGKFITTCTVDLTIRDINDHAPVFMQPLYVKSIDETAEIGTIIEKIIATDTDKGINAEIRYRIENGSSGDFDIDEKTGIVTVKHKLDFDRRNTYQMEIIASDSGIPSLSSTATLIVNVMNTNDKDPYFTPIIQETKVMENTTIGTTVHKLVAIDPDISSHDALKFAATEPITVIDEDGNNIMESTEQLGQYFSIESNGDVILMRPLDRKKFATIHYTVLVTDSTAPSIQQGKGELIISVLAVNRHPPKFVEPWTPENRRILYQIPEETPIGSTLTTLQAYDQESVIGEFKISSNNYFVIDNSTGKITTISRIDYEEVQEINFIATVSDVGVPPLTSTAEVTVNLINLNDNSPTFEQEFYIFNITENSPPGTVVGKVQAHDVDLEFFGEITYSLNGENSIYFEIDSFTGSIRVKDSSILDHEKNKFVNLTVIATDKAPVPLQKSASANIFINVLDVNDNYPLFTKEVYTARVPENASLNPPDYILKVTAEDLDQGVFGDIRYSIVSGNEDKLFRLDQMSGTIYPYESLQGRKGVYSLRIEARDNQGSGHNPSFARAVIEIYDVNQHQPKFVVPSEQNTTLELYTDILEAGHLLMTAKAYDNDTNENGKLSFYLRFNDENQDETNEFKVDSTTGEIRTKIDLKRKEQSEYGFEIVVRDHGTPTQLESTSYVKLILYDANGNRPEFPTELNPYKISINENSGKDVRIGKVEAFYRNKNLKDIYYYLILGNADGAFYIDKTTGEIYTNKSLDRETTDSYTLYILASNKQDLYISEAERASYTIKSLESDVRVATVNVTILDVNDNEPTFEKPSYYAGVNAKSTLNAYVAQVNASDKDFGENAKIEYFIITSNLYKYGSSKATGSIVPSPFTVSPEGRITTATFVAEYNQDRFELEVIAKETQPPERHAKTKVYVWIYDSSQLIRVILSRPPTEVQIYQDEIVSELRNATNSRIIIDELRYHVDSTGGIREDWCDLFFHAVDLETQQIVQVEDILKTIDASYDYLRDYYAGFAIENVVPAHVTVVEEEFDLALAGLAALIIVLFVAVVSFIVCCLCLKHWNLTVPMEKKRKETLIKKQIIEDLNTTENPLWIEQKLKLYEEQELTMQVFSEAEQVSASDTIPSVLERKDSFENLHAVDNTYATIQPRHNTAPSEIADYATLRNNRIPSTYEFTGSTFQVPIREDDAVAELI